MSEERLFSVQNTLCSNVANVRLGSKGFVSDKIRAYYSCSVRSDNNKGNFHYIDYMSRAGS